MYVGGAENDASFTADHAEQLDKALTAAGVQHTIEWYQAAHGFAVPDNAPYDAAAAERHWTAMTETFGRGPGLVPLPIASSSSVAATIAPSVRILPAIVFARVRVSGASVASSAADSASKFADRPSYAVPTPRACRWPSSAAGRPTRPIGPGDGRRCRRPTGHSWPA